MKLLQNWYQTQTQSNNLIYDEHQNTILQQLDAFITNNFYNRGFFANLFTKVELLGLYIYGNVGSGKTLIINELFRQIPEKRKIRIHFHQFMSNIHQELANLKNHEAPLDVIAKELKQKYQIIFLDEMHISDIATAMILKNLLNSLFKYRVYIVTSSNFAPNELYPDGLMRERFLGAIDLIEKKLQILNLNSNKDYRLIHNTHNMMFIINSDKAQVKLNNLFNKFANDNPVSINDKIIIQSRLIEYIKKSNHIIWFKFDIICGENRSQLDYLELSSKFDYIVVEGVEPIDARNKDTAKRLTWLVDVLYDNRKKIILSSSCGIGQIYSEGEGAIEFTRTVSRLVEMQTQEYLTQQSLESIAL